jgi:hypothetical protein
MAVQRLGSRRKACGISAVAYLVGLTVHVCVADRVSYNFVKQRGGRGRVILLAWPPSLCILH